MNDKEKDRQQTKDLALGMTAAGLAGRVLEYTGLDELRSAQGKGMPLSAPVYDVRGMRKFVSTGMPSLNNRAGLLRKSLLLKSKEGKLSDKDKALLDQLKNIKTRFPDASYKRTGSVAKAVDSFLKEHDLSRQGVRVNLLGPGGSADYYNPLKNTVNLRTNSSVVALHELARAADLKGSTLKSVLRKTPGTAAGILTPVALVYGDKIKEKMPGSAVERAVSFVQDHPMATVAAGYGISNLYPEAKASFLALKHLRKIRGEKASRSALKKYFLPALGLSALGAVPPVIMAGLGKEMVKERRREEGAAKTASEGFDLSESSRLTRTAKAKGFWRGFASAAPLTTVSLGYLYGTENGKKLRSILSKEEVPVEDKKPNFIERHPFTSAAAVGGTVGALRGLLESMAAKYRP